MEDRSLRPKSFDDVGAHFGEGSLPGASVK